MSNVTIESKEEEFYEAIFRFRKSLDEFIRKINELNNQMDSQMDDLEKNWQGKVYQDFRKKIEKEMDTIKAWIDFSVEFSKKLETVAKGLKEQNDKMKEIVR